ncbi:hypothetical protein [Pseudomonas sp. Marseille-Q1929]|uniref:hypothetical protein n=1 Tax=Pseudomonas sp. Marseille-Q1929 TaxID=2730402 RepID=UPI001A900A8E|nr:hypothetical protein [Pseudomonas sp. Marseille-Q1929]MBO0494447.1 hypothetical protein [Pseudomonas sp. Marseille-Q1929]
MLRRLFTPALALSAVFASPGAWAWHSEGDKIIMTVQERQYCRTWEADGIAAMWGRQENTEPPWQGSGTTDMEKSIRVVFMRQVQDYPIESTKEARMAVIEKYGKQMEMRCFGMITSKPSSKAP